MGITNVYKSDPQQLAKMMSLGAGAERIWQVEELAAILQHQFSAPIQFDLGAIDKGLGVKLRDLTDAEGLLLNSFSDLLWHPNPPVELLILTKTFAKSCKNHPDSPLPSEIATLLYYASIAVAMMRCGRRITTLDDAALRDGVQWLSQQQWLDDKTRSLLDDFISFLNGQPHRIE